MVWAVAMAQSMVRLRVQVAARAPSTATNDAHAGERTAAVVGRSFVTTAVACAAAATSILAGVGCRRGRATCRLQRGLRQPRLQSKSTFRLADWWPRTESIIVWSIESDLIWSADVIWYGRPVLSLES